MYRRLETFEFQTEANTTLTLTNGTHVAGVTLIYDYTSEGGTIHNSTGTTTPTFSTASVKTCKIYCSQIKKLNQLWTNLITTSQQKLTGSLNLSPLTLLRTVRIYNSVNLTAITFPTIESIASTGTAYIIYKTGCTTLNMSNLTNIGGTLTIQGNTSLTSITFPTQGANSANITSFFIGADPGVDTTLQNPALTSINLSGMNKFGGTVIIRGNSLLNSITWPTTLSVGVTNLTFFMTNTQISGNLNLSILTNINTSFTLQTNPNITSITFPTPTNPLINTLDIRSNNITGTLNVNMWTSMGSTFRTDNNVNLTGITFPTSTVSAGSAFVTFTIDTCNITGILDLSKLQKIGGTIIIRNNPNLTGITLPTSITASNNVSSLQLNSNNLTGTLDLSALTKIGGNIRIYLNTNLTSVTFPPTIDSGAANITDLHIYSCNLTSTLDLSMFTKIGGVVQLHTNTNLTGLTIPTTGVIGNNFTTFETYNTNIGTLNLSGLTKLGGNLSFYLNTSLTSITFPVLMDVGSGNFTIFRGYSNTNASYTTLTLTSLTKIGGIFQTELCTSLATLSLPTTGVTGSNFSIFYAYSCNLTGTLNLSGLTNLGADIRLYSNPNLTAITLPTAAVSAANVTNFFAYSCNLTGTLNLSTLRWRTTFTGLSTESVQIHSNPNLTGITFPALIYTQRFQAYGCGLNITFPIGSVIRVSLEISIQNNSMTTVNVDATISDLYTNRANHLNTGFKTLNISGTNAAPTGTLVAPSGYVQGSSDGTPANSKEMIYVLINQQNTLVDTTKKYKWTITTS